VQTHVPFVVWMSAAFRRDAGVTEECLRAEAKKPVSHDNLFHSLLGIFDVRTSAYDRHLDVFAACRGTPSSAAGTKP
jgi:lipid A ethanolaminephosphotransferase